MGSIRRFDIASCIKKYQLPYFVETGTWRGDSLAYAAKFSFKKLYSIEIVPEIAEQARKRFQNDRRIKILTGSSHLLFPDILKEIDGNALFWLDAHFPGAEEGIKGYNDHNSSVERLPLEYEIEIIRNTRKNNNDLIIIDDLRIYEDGPFESGSIPDNINAQTGKNLDFIESVFGNTHNILRLYSNEGYVIIEPKKIYSQPTSLVKLFNKLIRRKIF
jgi:hypothetical protein